MPFDERSTVRQRNLFTEFIQRHPVLVYAALHTRISGKSPSRNEVDRAANHIFEVISKVKEMVRDPRFVFAEIDMEIDVARFGITLVRGRGTEGSLRFSKA